MPKLNKNQFRVTIFGSARIKRNDPAYQEIFDLAKSLGERDIDVVTGGGPGLMEAGNAGHRAGNAGKSLSIGLQIKLPKEQKDNMHLDIKKEFHQFSGRLDEFMSLSNAVVVAQGGVGTLLELFYTWQHAQVHHIKHIPIILMGDMWPGLIEWLKREPLKRKMFNSEDLLLLYTVKTYTGVLEIIDQAFDDYQEDPKNYGATQKHYQTKL